MRNVSLTNSTGDQLSVLLTAAYGKHNNTLATCCRPVEKIMSRILTNQYLYPQRGSTTCSARFILGYKCLRKVMNTGDGSGPRGLTISVNTNWFNGFNLSKVHSFLKTELLAVRDALDHLREVMSEEGNREWERQCEVVMRANSALNMTDFVSIVTARARLLLAAEDDHASSCISASKAAVGERAEGGEVVRAEVIMSDGGTEIKHLSHVDTDSPSRPLQHPGCARKTAKTSRGSAMDERWRVFALEQAASVLREFTIEPYSSHLFLDAREKDGITGDDRWQTNQAEIQSMPGANSPSSVHEVLASIEAFLGSITGVECRAGNCR